MSQQPKDPVALAKQAIVEIDTLINEPPENENLREVREYRHFLYRKWEAASIKIEAALAFKDQQAQPVEQNSAHIINLINDYGRACRRDGNPAWESDEGQALQKALRIYAPVVQATQWPIRGVRVDEDKVIITVKGGNEAARWLCGELLAKHEAPAQASKEAKEQDDVLGTAVIVGGAVVAWFADFSEETREWCAENYFGQWLAWRAMAPEIIPLTEAEYDECMRKGKELSAKLKEPTNGK